MYGLNTWRGNVFFFSTPSWQQISLISRWIDRQVVRFLLFEGLILVGISFHAGGFGIFACVQAQLWRCAAHHGNGFVFALRRDARNRTCSQSAIRVPYEVPCAVEHSVILLCHWWRLRSPEERYDYKNAWSARFCSCWLIASPFTKLHYAGTALEDSAEVDLKTKAVWQGKLRVERHGHLSMMWLQVSVYTSSLQDSSTPSHSRW